MINNGNQQLLAISDLPVNLIPDLECSMGNRSPKVRETLQDTKSMQKVNELVAIFMQKNNKTFEKVKFEGTVPLRCRSYQIHSISFFNNVIID